MKMMFQFRKQKRWIQKQPLFPACPGQEASSQVGLQAGIMVSVTKPRATSSGPLSH